MYFPGLKTIKTSISLYQKSKDLAFATKERLTFAGMRMENHFTTQLFGVTLGPRTFAMNLRKSTVTSNC
jgi:hypothetical protein